MTSEAIPAKNREVRLASYPAGDVTPDNFEVAEVELNEPGEGQVLVRNDWMVLGTVYRDQMQPATDIPIPVFEIGKAMWGRTVGTVVRSNSPDLAVGDLVEHFYGWRDYASGYPQEFFPRDRDLLPGSEYFLSNGPTAWRGMVDTADVREGDVVFVSGATTGVGSIAGQIAKARGAKLVIGSTGSKDKVDLLKKLGYDAAFDYHDGPVADRLRELAPEGIDVYFDNVGGEQFEAALQVARPQARFALCGALSGQNGNWEGGAPRLPLLGVIPREITLKGFATLHTPDQISGWNAQFSEWLKEDRITYPHTAVEGGVPELPKALIGLFEGKYSGTVLAKLS